MLIPSLYENLLDSLPDGILVLDEKYQIIFANPALEQLCRVSFASLKGKPFSEFFCRNPHLQSVVERTFTTGASHHEMDYLYKTLDGASTPVLVTTSIIAGPAGLPLGLALTFRDVRVFKEIETTSRQMNQLAMLGRLAATMAHEIKNPLGGIRGSAQLLGMEMKDKGQRCCIDIIIKEVDRINRIVENALDLRRNMEIKTAPVNIHKVLNEILMLEKKNEKSSQILFRTEFDPSIPDIPADEGRMIQVFLNLIRNGVEAMDGEGEIVLMTRISSGYQVQQEKKESPSRMLLVEIRDSGKGIPQEIKENLFAPFFTTKKKGSGLGLAVSQQIIEKHEGWIKLEDNPSGGTSVKVLLPLK